MAAIKSPSPSGEGLGWGTQESRERTLLQRAAEMRRNLTEPEKRLWRHLSNSQLAGLKFRRQAVIGDRIVDFFCPSLGLIVEIDGDTHDRDVDARRDTNAAVIGLSTLRFTNADVIANLDGTLAAILDFAKNLPPRRNWRFPTPTPPLKGRG
jgi:very-short-patch-repair endonuclease